MARVVQTEFTYSEFLGYVESTPRVAGRGGIMKSSEDRDRTEWFQTDSWEQAMDYAKNGWQAGIDALAAEADLAVQGNTEVRHEIVGSTVDVGAFLSGSPECMVQFVDMQERDREELVVYAQLGYNAGTDGGEALKFSKKLLGELVQLNRDYSLKLVGVFSSHQSQSIRSDEFITIKDTYQNFILNSVAFSYHPSFFRRLWFKFIETKDYRDDGYGRSTDGDEFKRLCREYHGKTNPRAKSIIIPSVANIGLRWGIENLEIVKTCIE